jgi:hypothetical protein
MSVAIPANEAEVQGWSIYPELHENVSRSLSANGLSYEFHNIDNGYDCIRSYDTNITGRFKCRNRSCKTDGWSSKVVAITIRSYTGARYNARVYHQRCGKCHNLSRPCLDKTYMERIAYRLKKWNGLQVEAPVYKVNNNGPHYSNLCEGCKAGHCSAGRVAFGYTAQS